MTTTCVSCGSPIPEGQGRSCSMCYGDMAWGRDGYYEEWARQQEEKRDYERSIDKEIEDSEIEEGEA